MYNHPLSKDRLFKTFFRYIYFHILYNKDDEITIPFCDKKLIVIKGQGGQANYFTELNDYEEMLFLVLYLKEENTFFDIGANVGSYSVLAAITNDVNVHAFEPNSILFDIILKNIKINNLQDKLTAHHCALGEKNGYVRIINQGLLTHIIETNCVNSEKVELKCLDDIIDSANIMKIDVEGYEEKVLIGAEKLLNNPNLNAIIVEMTVNNRYGSSYQKVHAILSKFGYNPFSYDPINRQLNKREKYIPNCKSWWNVIYIKNIDLALNCVKSSKKFKVNGRWY